MSQWKKGYKYVFILKDNLKVYIIDLWWPDNKIDAKIIKDVLRNLEIEIKYKPSEILSVMNYLGYIWW